MTEKMTTYAYGCFVMHTQYAPTSVRSSGSSSKFLCGGYVFMPCTSCSLSTALYHSYNKSKWRKSPLSEVDFAATATAITTAATEGAPIVNAVGECLHEETQPFIESSSSSPAPPALGGLRRTGLYTLRQGRHDIEGTFSVADLTGVSGSVDDWDEEQDSSWAPRQHSNKATHSAAAGGMSSTRCCHAGGDEDAVTTEDTDDEWENSSAAPLPELQRGCPSHFDSEKREATMPFAALPAPTQYRHGRREEGDTKNHIAQRRTSLMSTASSSSGSYSSAFIEGTIVFNTRKTSLTGQHRDLGSASSRSITGELPRFGLTRRVESADVSAYDEPAPLGTTVRRVWSDPNDSLGAIPTVTMRPASTTMTPNVLLNTVNSVTDVASANEPDAHTIHGNDNSSTSNSKNDISNITNSNQRDDNGSNGDKIKNGSSSRAKASFSSLPRTINPVLPAGPLSSSSSGEHYSSSAAAAAIAPRMEKIAREGSRYAVIRSRRRQAAVPTYAATAVSVGPATPSLGPMSCRDHATITAPSAEPSPGLLARTTSLRALTSASSFRYCREDAERQPLIPSCAAAMQQRQTQIQQQQQYWGDKNLSRSAAAASLFTPADNDSFTVAPPLFLSSSFANPACHLDAEAPPSFSEMIPLASAFAPFSSAMASIGKSTFSQAVIEDQCSEGLYYVLCRPPSSQFGNAEECRQLYTVIRSMSRGGVVLWETVSVLLNAEDQIRYGGLHGEHDMLSFDQFVEFVELASIRYRS